jgi:CheY-like chemotaxis protein
MATRGGKFINSILLVDDDEDSLDLYAHLLKERLNAEVQTTRYPSKALKLSQKHFFDMVVIDVTIDFNGTPFGGLELYKSLMGRYGDSSLIVYSQFITDDLLKQYDYDFNFIERGTNPIRFIDKLVGTMDSLRKKQTCFVAMPFHKSYMPLYRAVETCVKRASYRCVRIDRQHFTKSIVEKIFTEINNAKLIIFLATDQNPNAFYECGYAVALNKEVITLTDVHKNLPFDIRDRNAIAYGTDLKSLKSALADRLSNLTRSSSR